MWEVSPPKWCIYPLCICTAEHNFMYPDCNRLGVVYWKRFEGTCCEAKRVWCSCGWGRTCAVDMIVRCCSCADNQGGNNKLLLLSQFFSLTVTGELRQENSCAEIQDPLATPVRVVMFRCHGQKGNQQWRMQVSTSGYSIHQHHFMLLI
jgi:hypothetical protein